MLNPYCTQQGALVRHIEKGYSGHFVGRTRDTKEFENASDEVECVIVSFETDTRYIASRRKIELLRYPTLAELHRATPMRRARRLWRRLTRRAE